MTEGDEKPATPTPTVRLGKVNTLRAARRAMVRVTEAVLSGQLPPRIANSAMYGLSSIARVLEVEVIEQRLEALEDRAGAPRKASDRGRFIGHA